MTQNDEKLTRSEYQRRQKNKNPFKRFFSRSNHQPVEQTVENPDFETTFSKKQLTTEQKIQKAKRRLNIGIVTCAILIIIVFLVLFFVK